MIIGSQQQQQQQQQRSLILNVMNDEEVPWICNVYFTDPIKQLSVQKWAGV